MIRVAVTGASGLVGECLLRLLLEHPQVEVTFLGSHNSAGKDIAEVNVPEAGHNRQERRNPPVLHINIPNRPSANCVEYSAA